MKSIKNILKKFKSNEFYSNFTTLMSSSIISQAIPILISPLLSRIYTPADFSLLAIYLAITNLLAVIATGRYDLAIMLPEKDEDAINLLALSIFISFILFLFLLPISIIFPNQIAKVLKNEILSKWLVFTSLSVFLNAIYQSIIYWNNRNKNFKIIAINRIIQSSTGGFFQIIFGYFLKSINNGFIIVGQFLGQFLAVSRLVFLFLAKDKNKINRISFKKMRDVGKRYSDFPKKTSLSSILTIFSNNGRYLVLSFFIDSASLGSLFFTFRILMLPVSIIGNNIADLVYQKVTEMKNKYIDKVFVKKYINKLIKQLFSLLVLPVIFLFLFGSKIFAFVFGSNYNLAGKYASILSFAVLFQFAVSPFSKIFYVYEKNTLYLIWEIIRIFIFYIPIFILKFLKVKSIYFIISISLSMVITYCILYIFLQRILNEKIHRI